MFVYPEDIEFAYLDYFIEEHYISKNGELRKITSITNVEIKGELWQPIILSKKTADIVSTIVPIKEVPGSYDVVSNEHMYIRTDLNPLLSAYSRFMSDVALFRRFLRTEEARLVTMLELLGIGYVEPGVWPSFKDLWNVRN